MNNDLFSSSLRKHGFSADAAFRQPPVTAVRDCFGFRANATSGESARGLIEQAGVTVEEFVKAL